MTPHIAFIAAAITLPVLSQAENPKTDAGPVTIGKAAAATTSPGPYEKFYNLGFIPETLAADASRAKELAFVLSCRERLAGEYTRGASSRELIERFRKEFDDTKVADATRLAVMTLISEKKTLTDDGDLDYFMKLNGQLTCAAPEEKAYALRLRAIHAGRWCFGFDGEKERKALFDMLMKDLRAPWLTRRPMLATSLFLAFEPDGWTSRIANGDGDKINIGFLDAMEKIPVESRGYPENLFIGRAHRRKAWQARGSAWASETTDAQFAGFKKHLAIAADALKRARDIEPRRVRPWMELMTVSMADAELAGSDVATLLDGARKCPSFSPEVVNHAAFCSAARWRGDTGLILQVTDELIDAGYDGEGPYYAFLAFREFLKDTHGDKRERCRDFAANMLVKIANGYIARDIATKSRVIDGYGQPLDMRALTIERLFQIDRLSYVPQLIDAPGLPKGYDNGNEYPVGQGQNHGYLRALVALETGDKTTLDDIFPVFPNALTDTWDAKENDATISRQRIRHADPAFLKSADERLAVLEKKCASDDTRRYLKDLRELLAKEGAVINGGTITLPFAATLWDKPYGHWKFAGAKTDAWTRENNPGFHEALSLGWFRPPYELTLHVQKRWSGTGCKTGVTIGRLPGWQQAPHKAPGCCFLRQYEPDHLMVMKAFPFTYKSPVVVRAPDKVKDYTITVRVMEHGYTVGMTGVAPQGLRDDDFTPSVIAVGNYPTFPGWGSFVYDAPVIRGLKPEELSIAEKSWMEDNPAQAAKRKADATGGA